MEKIIQGEVTRDHTQYFISDHQYYDYCIVEFESGRFSKITCHSHAGGYETLSDITPLYKELKNLATR